MVQDQPRLCHYHSFPALSLTDPVILGGVCVTELHPWPVSMPFALQETDGSRGSAPEVAGDPVILPLLIVLVRDLEVHLVGYPGHADPHHQRQRVGEAPAGIITAAELAVPLSGTYPTCIATLHINAD